MANVNVNTQSAGYITQHANFVAIVTFWKPLLIEFFKLDRDQRQAWRQNDPFLNDILRFVQAVVEEREDNL
jgi:hypothetical protein